jgi:hypothetical protein
MPIGGPLSILEVFLLIAAAIIGPAACTRSIGN